jgi:hypothetical protein
VLTFVSWDFRDVPSAVVYYCFFLLLHWQAAGFVYHFVAFVFFRAMHCLIFDCCKLHCNDFIFSTEILIHGCIHLLFFDFFEDVWYSWINRFGFVLGKRNRVCSSKRATTLVESNFQIIVIPLKIATHRVFLYRSLLSTWDWSPCFHFVEAIPFGVVLQWICFISMLCLVT